MHTTWRAWPFVTVVRLFRPPDRGFGVPPRDWQTVTHPFQQKRTQPDSEKKNTAIRQADGEKETMQFPIARLNNHPRLCTASLGP